MEYLIITETGKIIGAIGGGAILPWIILRTLAHKNLQDAAGDEDKDPSQAVDDIAKLMK